MRAARAQAALQGRGFVTPDDVRAVAVPVLAHRLLLAPDARAARRSTAEPGARPADPAAGAGTGPNLSVQADPRSGPAQPPSRTRRAARALGAAGRRADRTVLSTRGRCLLAAGVATAACAVPLAERDLLRVGAFATFLPLLALLLALPRGAPCACTGR